MMKQFIKVFHLRVGDSIHPGSQSNYHAIHCNSQNDWAEHFPMVEFTLNSSVSASMGYAPFELNYRYIPQLGQCLNTNSKFVGVHQFTEQALWNIMAAHDAIIAAHMMQMHHANFHR